MSAFFVRLEDVCKHNIYGIVHLQAVASHLPFLPVTLIKVYCTLADGLTSMLQVASLIEAYF